MLYEPARPQRFLTSESATSAMLVGGFLVGGVVLGLVVATGSVPLIAVTLGSVIGLALLNWTASAIWLLLIGTLVVSGPVAFYVPSMAKLPWLFSLLGFFLLGAAAVHAGLARRETRRPVPTYVAVMIMSMVYGVSSLAWSQGDLTEGLAGIKRTYQAFGLMCALAVIPYSARSVRNWALFLLAIAILQVPLAVYQRVSYVPNMEAGMDAVVGFLELTRRGSGAAGVLAFMQILVFAGILLAWRERFVSTLWAVAMSIMVLLPLLISEVNVIFIWIPIAVVAAFLDVARRHPGRFVLGGAAFISAIAVFGSLYIVWQQMDDRKPVLSSDRRIENILEYNFGTRGYAGASDLNRSTVYSYWAQHHGLHDPIRFAFGHGLGATSNTQEKQTSLIVRHGGINLGLVTTSTLLWELGLVGTLLYGVGMALGWSRALRLSNSVQSGMPRLLARATFVSMSMLIVGTTYNASLVNTLSQQVLAALTLGLIAWLERFGSHADEQPPGRSRPGRVGHFPEPI